MSPWKVAAIRSLIGAILGGTLTFLTTYSSGASLKISLIAAGTMAVSYLIARGVAEGWYDTSAARLPQVGVNKQQ